jgi:hypothetical protein
MTAFIYAFILTPFILLPVAWWVDRRNRRTDEQMRKGMRLANKLGWVKR